MTTTSAPSSPSADAAATPLPDVIRIVVEAQYDGEDWTDLSVKATAEEVAGCLRYRYPHLASVTLDESGGWLRVIERPSWDAPVERYRILGMDAGCIDRDSSEDDWQHVRLVRLGCDDPGPEESPIVPPDEREPDDHELIGSVQHRAALQSTNRMTGEETKPVIATETPAAESTADEMALAAASVPPKRSSTEKSARRLAARLQAVVDAEVVDTPGALAVTVAREPLRAALRTVVTAAASGRVIVPITANVLIETRADDPAGGLFLTCTDLSQRLSVAVVATVEADGAYTVPAKLLSQLVDTFTAPDVTLRQDGEVLRVASGKSRGHLKGINAAEFPEDRRGAGDTCTLPAAVLRRALTLAEWAAARDESRPVLKGVCLAAASGTLVAQAADGTVMSYWSVPLAGVPDCTALLPRDTAETMAKLLAAREGDVSLSLLPSAAQPNVVRLTFVSLLGEPQTGPATLSTRTSEGQYPSLLRVVPQTHTVAITVQRTALLGAVRQAGVVADRVAGKGGLRPIVLVSLRAETGADGADATDGTLHVWSTNASVGEQRTEIAASITSEGGEPLHWNLDGTYLVEMLGALNEALDGEPAEADDGAVTLRLTSALMPVRFGCAALPEWIGVVMPMSGGAE